MIVICILLILGKIIVFILFCIIRLIFVVGFLLISSLFSLVVICLVLIWVNCGVIFLIVVCICGVIVNLSCEMNCVVCSICNGLLLKDFDGVVGVFNILVCSVVKLLSGFRNLFGLVVVMCIVIVFVVKLWWIRLFLR